MSGRPKAPLVLTEAERKELVALTLRRKTAQALALRARIVPKSATMQADEARGCLSIEDTVWNHLVVQQKSWPTDRVRCGHRVVQRYG